MAWSTLCRLGFMIRNELFRRLSGTLEPRYSAGGGAKPDIRFSDDTRTLMVRGIHFDTVDGLTTTFEFAKDLSK